MILEKILVGDDQLDFARENFPFIPNTKVEFVSKPEELIERALTGNYSMIVTDLNYTENGEEGYKILKALQNVDIRKVLWTGNAYDKGVKEKAQFLGAEVLDKDEISTLVGQIVSKAPIKQYGKVLVYVAQNYDSVRLALEQTIGLFFSADEVRISSRLKDELISEQYGLVIDTSPITSQEKVTQGVVVHDMKYFKLKEVPRVITVNNISNVVVDIARIAGKYLNK